MDKVKDFLTLFVFPNHFSSLAYSPSLGAIASVLKKNKITTHLIHIHKSLDSNTTEEHIANKIIEKKPDLVGFTSTSLEYTYVTKVAHLLKEKGINAPLICGGPHATLCPEDFENSPFDIWCRGEGELAMLELAQRMIKKEPFYDIRNLYFKKDGKIIENPIRKQIRLDEMPYYDRELFDMHRILPLKSGWLDIFVERGCPYECSYCCNHAFNRMYKEETGENIKYRIRNVASVIVEIKELLKTYGDLVKVLNFQDDLIGLNKSWLEEFCAQYKKEIGMPFSINVRVGVLGEKEVILLKQANCFEFRIGLESGSNHIREKVLKRKMSNEKIKELFALAKKHEVNTFAYCMVGIPEESPQHIMETIDLLAEIKPRMIRCAIFFPFRGTQLYDECREKNCLPQDYNETDSVPSYFESSILKLNTLSAEQIIEFQRLLGWCINVHSNNGVSNDFQELIENLSGRIKQMHFSERQEAEQALLKKTRPINHDFYHIDRNSSNWLLHAKDTPLPF